MTHADRALMRLALLASGDSLEAVFSAVVEEAGHALGLDVAWLVRDGTAVPLRVWPAGRQPPDTGAVSAPIVVDGVTWGALAGAGDPLPEGVASLLQVFSALVAVALSRSALVASRERIAVAADETRRRFERDLHDGPQQRLVSLAMELRLVQQDAPPELGVRISGAVDGITSLLDELRELARSLHPGILSEGGLRPALRALARRSSVPVQLRETPDERFDAHVEIAAYHVVAEALAHADAAVVDVSVERRDDRLRVVVHGARAEGVADRVEALGGSIAVRGEATEVELPLARSSG
jgi:signal transduction histidine kinase